MAMEGSWLSRYLGGDRDGLWIELRQLGDRVREPEVFDDAQAVCNEMASRARQNVEAIIERLTHQWYVFHTNDDARSRRTPHHSPGARAGEVADWLGRSFSAVPLTLLSWLHEVGDVWLVGTHPDWPESTSADPLVIELEGSMYPDQSIIDYFDDEFAAHAEATGVAGEMSSFHLPVAPDRLHKDNVSGGPPYGFVLPDGCADGLFVVEMTIPFVSYLNWVFANGGFPSPTGSPAEWRIKQALAADLLPL